VNNTNNSQQIFTIAKYEWRRALARLTLFSIIGDSHVFVTGAVQDSRLEGRIDSLFEVIPKDQFES